MEKETKQILVSKLYRDIKFSGLVQEGKKHSTELEKVRIHSLLFYSFLKENEKLTDDEIREVLNANNKFSLLRKLDSLLPNFFNELKMHGPVEIERLYVELKKGDKGFEV